MNPIRIGLVGLGKIAIDQHIPAMRNNLGFELVAGAAPNAPDIGVPTFADAEAMLKAVQLDAVAIATPPAPRYAIARQCIEAGLDVLLEKPPCSTLGEAQDIAALAKLNGRVAFGAWHSRFNAAVQRAATITGAEGIASMEIAWLEDAEKWHPGQQWIWEAGGFGVFDSGMNALSIASLLSPEILTVESAQLTLHKEKQQAVAANVALRTASASQPFQARFDWRHKGEEQWTIKVLTAAGTSILLTRGGAALSINDELIPAQSDEYKAVYEEFAHLVAAQETHVDTEPLRIAADIFLKGRRG